MLMAMNLSREYTAILESAFNVSYEKIENQIGNLTFSMPLDDPKNVFLQEMLWVELTDNENEYIGLYRVMPSTIQKDAANNTITYSANHALCTLLDTVLFGYYETINKKTADVINFILSKQTTKHWVLKNCQFNKYFSYSWENENGLADALFSIPEVFDEEYLWTWNTQTYPFELSLMKPTMTAVARIQEGYNMQGFEIERDPNNLVNRVYPLGSGEGVNQLNIRSVNNGIAHLENQASIKKHGLIEYVWTDTRFTQAQALKESAHSLLKKWSEPKVSWTIKATDLMKLTNQPLTIDQLRIGNVVMVNTNDFGSVDLRIKRESKRDVFGAPQDIELELGNLSGDINTTMSDISRKQQINETYSQGATNILNYSYQDNCERDYPAVIDFYLDDDVFHVNTVELTFKTKRYRGYTKAVKGGGARSITSESGGSNVVTSEDGGSKVVTSHSGGGTTQTSTAGGGYSNGSTTEGGGGSTQSSGGGGDHTHVVLDHHGRYNTGHGVPTKETYIGRHAVPLVMIETLGAGGDLVTASASGAHSHTVNIPTHSHRFSINIPSHSHNLSIPAHSHNVSLPSHKHNVKLPAHKHEVVLPEHTHPLQWGIYEANESANSVDIIVDGQTLPHHEITQDRLNIVDYLRKSSGKIQRGNHTIEIKPNRLARIEAQVTCRVFIQSQIGGQF
ncbi:phage tail protein [Enterococcus sp. AZ109]|uniref:phage tail protein n=1 Tax=Enterococcus sp. AZ109 TaxID=2774634 RepID=UPI003F22105A